VATNRTPTHTRVQVKGTIGKSVRLQQPAADLATLVAQLTPSIQGLIATAPPPIATSTFVYFQNVIGVPPQVLVAPNRMPQEDTFEDPYPVPGPQGVSGVAGRSLPPLLPDDPEDVAIIPGPQGLRGLNGPVGEPGVPVFMPNDFDLEDAVVIPGPQGLRGLPGIQGLPIFIDADDPEYPYNASGPPAMGANPTASLGLAAINGVSLNFMRADGAPKLDVTISPTMTGNWVFSATSGISASFNSATAGTPAFRVNGAGGSNSYAAEVHGNTAAASRGLLLLGGVAGTTDQVLTCNDAASTVNLFTVDANAVCTIYGTLAGVAKLSLNTQATTGSQTATFTATNKPGTGTTGPDKWIPVLLDGTTHYVPAFL
jgi:hypothetical protein